MCGRFTQTSTPQRLQERFALAAAPAPLAPRYNVAPTQDVLVIANRAQRLARPARWGLVPFWAKDTSIGNRMINARVETLAQRSAFRDPLERRRCVVPADGFYEWQRQGGRRRQPFYLRPLDTPPLALAGLWDLWTMPSGERLASFTIITVPANGTVSPIHDRMPAILWPEAVDAWLDPAPMPAATLLAWLAPSPDDALDAYPVSTWVNTADHDDPQCIVPA
jgi:putative SOS response-associated peptidase YedK